MLENRTSASFTPASEIKCENRARENFRKYSFTQDVSLAN